MTARPRTMAEVAARRAARPDIPLWKPMCEFLDEFYEEQSDRLVMLVGEPVAPIAREEAAYFAASTEYLCGVYELPCPAWVMKPVYILDAPFWPHDCLDGMKALLVTESPEPFRRRNIYTERRPLRRKAGPRPPSGGDDWWRA